MQFESEEGDHKNGPGLEFRSQKKLPPNPSSLALLLRDHFRRDPLRDERLDHVASLDVAVVRDRDTALHAARHLRNIVFHAAQRTDFAFENHRVIPQQAHFGIALDQAIGYTATSDGSNFWYTEGLQHFGAALVVLLDGRFEQAGHGALDLILEFVNDRVQANVDFFLIGQFLRFAFWTHVEPDDDRVRR